MSGLGALGRLQNLLHEKFLGVFGRFFSAKLTVAATAIATFFTLLVGLTAAFNAAMQSIQMAMPSEFSWGLGLIPTNIPVCISAIITMRLALWVYYIKWQVVRIKVGSV